MASTVGSRSGTLFEGTFGINGDQCTVTLTSEALKWQPVHGKSEDQHAIPIEEILSTTLSPGKAKNPNDSVLKLVYMEHQENQMLGRATVTIVGKADICTTWSRRIQERLDAVIGRPKSALVVINPASGDKEGPELYREKAAPIFLEASVKTHVIESVNHVNDLISGYDLTSIDCIVAVGGDGTYHLIADPLLQRQMKEADLDLNDPDTDIPETCLPIGIIPCGSGNACAFQLFGTFDAESIALGIIRGRKQKLPIQGVWSGGELVVYSFLFVGIGAVADWMYDAQNMRDKGKDRYQILMAKYNLKESVRSADVTIETRPPILASKSTNVNNVEDVNLSDVTTRTSARQPWTTSYQGRTPMMSEWISDFMGIKESKDVAHLDFTRLFVMKEWDRSLFFTHMKQLGSFDSDALHIDGIQHIPCTEYKLTIHNPEEQEGRANMLIIDGEIYYSKQPNFYVKLIPGKLNMFASVAPDFIINNSPCIL